jgi:hypothetical protein
MPEFPPSPLVIDFRFARWLQITPSCVMCHASCVTRHEAHVKTWIKTTGRGQHSSATFNFKRILVVHIMSKKSGKEFRATNPFLYIHVYIHCFSRQYLYSSR